MIGNQNNKIQELIKIHNNALNQIKSPMDNLIKVNFEEIPCFVEKHCQKYGKTWVTIDQDVYFERIFKKMIDFDPLFIKVSTDFKNRIKTSIFSSFNDVNFDPIHEKEMKSKKYPTWARFWYEFYTGAGINGYLPWENINDQIIFNKYDNFILDQKECDKILGFDFYEEYRKIKKQKNGLTKEHISQQYRNSFNKKVS